MGDLHDVAAWVESSIAPQPGPMRIWDYNGHTRIDASRDRGGEGYLDPNRRPPDDDDTAPGLETSYNPGHPYTLDCTARRGDEDYGRPFDHPSPGDDITRVAFDAIDQA